MEKVASLFKKAYDGVAQQVAQGQTNTPANMSSDQQTQDPESAFEMQIKDIMGRFLSAKYPWLRPDSKISIIDLNIDNNSVVASVDLDVNGVVLKIPLVYSDGEISEPWAIFVEGENRFFEFSQPWYERIIKSAEVNDGQLTGWENNGYYTAYNDTNRVLEPNSVGGVLMTRYAALNKLSLQELQPVVKLALANGYIYEQFGRMAIKVASQKLINKSKEVKRPNGFKVKKGSLYVFDRNGIKNVTAGLTLKERVGAFNQISKLGYAIVDKRMDDGKLNVYDVEGYGGSGEETAYVTPLESLLDTAHKIHGSFDKRSGEPIFYVPSDIYLRDRVTTGTAEIRKQWKLKLEVGYEGKDRNVFRNENEEGDFIAYAEKNKESQVPEWMKAVIDNDEKKFNVERSKLSEKDYSYNNFYIVPVVKKADKFVIKVELSRYTQFNELRDVFRYFALDGYDNAGHILDDRDLRFVALNAGNVSGRIFTDMSEFVFRSATFRDYFQNGFSVKRNVNGTYDMTVDGIKVQTDEQKEASFKFTQLSKAASAFVLGNYVGAKVEDILTILDRKGTSKYAASLSPELAEKLQSLVSIIDSLKTDIENPEAQKKALDATGGEGQVSVNIENYNATPTDAAAAPAEMPVEEGTAPEGTPDINTLMAEAQKIGIPQDLIQQLADLAPMMGVTPEEAIIQAGSMVEQGINQGMPSEEVINQLRASVSQVMTQTGGSAPASVNTAASMPMEQVAPDSNIPAATDSVVQEAGQNVVGGGSISPMAGSAVPMASAPVTETMVDPNVQQGMSQVASPAEVQDVTNKGVLADIIGNATIKTQFIDFVPEINNTINTLSEMILRLELKKTSLNDEVGTSNVDSVSEKLRLVLKQLGELVLQVVSFK